MRFALLGAAGYCAEKHLAAIKEVGGELVACHDPHDSVGILDSYFPDCEYRPKEGDFWQLLTDLAMTGKPVEWLSVVTPNYLHSWQARMGVGSGMNVICEKPLALDLEDLDLMAMAVAKRKKRIFCVHQLRYHPDYLALKDTLNGTEDIHADMTYWTPRGRWYWNSWKADMELSGGLLMNIGIHYFDLLIDLLGPVKRHTHTMHGRECYMGHIEFERGEADWDFSVKQGQPLRSLVLDGHEVDLGVKAINSLHGEVYRRALKGEGVGVEDCRPAIKLVKEITG